MAGACLSTRSLLGSTTRQLRIWEACKYDIYIPDPKTGAERKEKAAYKVWKKERDAILGQGVEAVNKNRFAAIGATAADFGRRRLKALDAEGDKKEGRGGAETGEEIRRKDAWQRVTEMENDWTKRLIATGDDPLQEQQRDETHGDANEERNKIRSCQ